MDKNLKSATTTKFRNRRIEFDGGDPSTTSPEELAELVVARTQLDDILVSK